MDRPFYESNLARLHLHMSEIAFRAVWTAGVAMSLEQAVACALGGQLGLPVM